eukprot:jgi/Ulvmu1/4267/UM194_0007.1
MCLCAASCAHLQTAVCADGEHRCACRARWPTHGPRTLTCCVRRPAERAASAAFPESCTAPPKRQPRLLSRCRLQREPHGPPKHGPSKQLCVAFAAVICDGSCDGYRCRCMAYVGADQRDLGHAAYICWVHLVSSLPMANNAGALIASGARCSVWGVHV